MYIRKIVQSFGTKVKPLKVSALPIDHGVKVQSLTSEHGWEIHNPLESVLGALAGCQYVTLKGITSHGKIHVKSAKFTKVQSSYNLEMFMKGGKDNHLNQIFIEAEIETTGTQQDLNQIQKKVANSCPVYQMLTASGIKINNNWKNIQVAQ